MRATDSSRGGGAGQFRTARWALVMAFAQEQSRKGQAALAALCLESSKNRYRFEPLDHLTPEKIFGARWTLTLLNDLMTVLRPEHVSRGKGLVFDTLKGYVGIGESTPEAAYDQVAKALGVDLGTVKTLIHRRRKRYFAVVREEVERTVSNPAEIDEQIRAL